MANPEPAPVDGAARTPDVAPAGNTVAAAATQSVTTEPAIARVVAPAVPPPPPETAPACGNCGVPLQGKYCHACGQKDFDFRRSFGAVVSELVETFLNFDTKLLRGMYALLFQPGKLTLDFLAGKRTSQVPPLRFYIFLSIVSFVWVGAGDRPNIQVAESLDRELAAKPVLQTKEAQDTAVMKFLQRASSRESEVNTMFREYLPQLFLLCVPVLAVLLCVAFRRARLTYLQHLVAAVHLQTFALLIGVTVTGWGRILGLFWRHGYQTMRFLGLLYFFYYGFLALRRIYGESTGQTLLKGTGVLFAYWCAMLLSMAVVVFAVLLFL